MTRSRLRSNQQGFTLLEMALSLFTIGLLVASVPTLLKEGSLEAATAPAVDPLDQAEHALNGFVLTHGRLPCPAQTPQSGVENCGITRGYIPHGTLGLAAPVVNSRGFGLVYGVYADSAGGNHLAQATAKFTPTYLSSHANYWQTSSTLSSNQINTLDFCAKLRSVATGTTNPGLLGVLPIGASSGLNMAWVVVDPGRSDSDHSGTSAGGALDGLNRATGTSWFESPGRTDSPEYDDRVRAVSPAQMFAYLRCPATLSAVSAAAREADFADDHYRVRQFLLDFREREKTIREEQEDKAYEMKVLAGFDVALSAALGVLDLGIGLAGAAGAISIAASLVNAIATITLSALALEEAIDAHNEAITEVAESTEQVQTATEQRDAALTLRTERRSDLLLLDQRGLFQ